MDEMPAGGPRRKSSVLLLTHYYPAHRGGVEVVAGHLARRLGQTFTLKWLASDCDPCPTFSEVECRPQRAWNGFEARGLPWPIWSFHGWWQLRVAIGECDVLHLHDFIYPANILALLLAKWAKKPAVVTQHIGDIEYRNPLLRGILKLINRTVGRWLLSRASQVVFISSRVKRDFEAFTHFSRPPLYWPNGVDSRIFREQRAITQEDLRRNYGLIPHKPVILFVGRFVDKKGLPVLRQLAAARPEWQWCLAGWGPIDPARWGLPNVHVWTGLQGESLAPLYQLADLFVLPSHGEGFPLVVQESLACGTPVVISEETAAGGPDMPGCIFSVPHSPHCPNPGVWLSVIEAYLNSDQKLECRHRSAQQAEMLWNWDRLAEKYAGLFRRLAG